MKDAKISNGVTKQKIYLGADHAGFKLKESIKEYLEKQNLEYQDMGNKKFVLRDDFIDFGKKVAQKVSKEKNSLGILICGSGQGMCMTANRFKKVRAAIGHSVAAAKRAKHDDDNNILCLAGRALSTEQAKRIVRAWLTTEFAGLARYKRRIKKLG